MPVLNGISDLTYFLYRCSGRRFVRLLLHATIMRLPYVWQVNQPIQNLTQLAGVSSRALSLRWIGFFRFYHG